jgi:hypothetical protein
MADVDQLVMESADRIRRKYRNASPSPLVRVPSRRRNHALGLASGLAVIVGFLPIWMFLRDIPDTADPAPIVASTAMVQAGEATRTIDGCPVTLPNGYIPPDSYPSEPPGPDESMWHGSADLWTRVGTGGEIWSGLPTNDGRPSQKLFWWSEGYFWLDNPQPSLVVRGVRLDQAHEEVTLAWTATNGFREDMESFMLSWIELPSEGCWQITGTYGSGSLSFVVLVR